MITIIKQNKKNCLNILRRVISLDKMKDDTISVGHIFLSSIRVKYKHDLGQNVEEDKDLEHFCGGEWSKQLSSDL